MVTALVERVIQFFSPASAKAQETIRSFFAITYPEHPSYKMLLIGETGSGKTSLINLFCNCALIEHLGGDQLKLSEIQQFNDIELEDSESKKMQSKTTGAKEYHTTLNKLEIRIINTPGFGDTRGFKQDKQNTKIIEILKSKEHINCVCLVINGHNAHLNPAIK